MQFHAFIFVPLSLINIRPRTDIMIEWTTASEVFLDPSVFWSSHEDYTEDILLSHLQRGY